MGKTTKNLGKITEGRFSKILIRDCFYFSKQHMKPEKYEFFSDPWNLDFEFHSVGPKGRIKKFIQFRPQNTNGRTYFSVSFGDWSEEKKDIDDRVVTNNSDSKKVLDTVAASVEVFTNQYPDMGVYAEGSTAARTRLCQMGICANWHEIKTLFHVFGLLNDKWCPFEKNINYNAFFVVRK